MKFSYNWLQDYLQEKLPEPGKLAEILMLHAFEVEGVDKVGSDSVLDVDILPNRSDCLSHLGLAREIAALTQNKLKALEQEEIKAGKGNLKEIKLKIECQELVPRYSAIVVENIKMGPSPQWLKDKLESLGARSINNIVDLTNFVMIELGQPLHAFDYDKILDQKITLRLAKKGEKVVTLDDLEHELDESILVAEDKNRLIDLVGIMGGKLSEIDASTKNIVLQAAAFDRQSIYRAAKTLGHSSDASAIYVQGTDPNITTMALARSAHLLKQLGEGTVAQIIDIYPKEITAKKIKLDTAKVNSLLGTKIAASKIKDILQDLHFKVKGNNKLDVEVPTFRQDICLSQDLIEEIGRIYGYDKVKAQMPKTTLSPPKLNDDIVYENKLRDILAGFGFSETYNYSFISPQTSQSCHVQAVELSNPVSQEQKYLRPCLIPNLLKNVKDNLRYFEQISLFEIGNVFNVNKQNQIEEKKNIAGVLVLGSKAKDSQEFYSLKGIVDSLFNKLAISDIWYDDAIEEKDQILNSFHPVRRAQVKIGNQLLGWIGEIDRRVLNNYGIKEKIAIFELDFKEVVKQAIEERIYLPPSKFPALVRDISILVERNTRVSEALNLINTIGGKLVADVDLFDTYEGEQLPEGKKSLAFHIVYQAEDKTLTEKEVDRLHQKIVQALEKEGGWEVRK